MPAPPAWKKFLDHEREKERKRKRGTLAEFEPYLRGSAQNRHGGQQNSKVRARKLYRPENTSSGFIHIYTAEERAEVEQRLITEGILPPKQEPADTGENKSEADEGALPRRETQGKAGLPIPTVAKTK